MVKHIFLLPGINPEPWAVGPLGYRNVNGKPRPFIGPNLKLQSYQSEVKEEISRVLGSTFEPFKGLCGIAFFFWRRLDTWETSSGKKSGAHQADATNLQKATEDALQGVLISNDRNVRATYSEIIEQERDINPGIIIALYEDHLPMFLWDVGDVVMNEFNSQRNKADTFDLGNDW